MLVVLAGPALVGKSPIAEAAIEPKRGEVLIDYSLLFSALTTVPRGALRPSRVPLPLVESVREHAIREAVARELNGFVTVASGTALRKVRQLAPAAAVLVMQPQRADLERLIARGPEARATSTELQWIDECTQAAVRWYETYEPGEVADYYYDMTSGRPGKRIGSRALVRFEPDNPDLLEAFERVEPLLKTGAPKFNAWALERLLAAGHADGARMLALLTRIEELADQSSVDDLVALAVANGWIDG